MPQCAKTRRKRTLWVDDTTKNEEPWRCNDSLPAVLPYTKREDAETCLLALDGLAQVVILETQEQTSFAADL